MFEYKILKKSAKSSARLGVFTTPHGEIETPVFMPVGTVAAVKTMRPDQLSDLGAQIVLANAYHLYLRPGVEVISSAGGLHSFSRLKCPILTDSGGYQVFSLGAKVNNRGNQARVKKAEISEDGVTFYSHLDGSKHFFTPERSIATQQALGADIIMAFDECPPAPSSAKDLSRATRRTHSWLKRCLKAKTRDDQALFGICQGGADRRIREDSAAYIASLDLPGNAVGGVSVGEKKELVYQVAAWCGGALPENKPRYLMGVGYPEDIAKAVALGMDMFDCVLPTRLARHGVAWVRSEDGAGTKISGLNTGYDSLNLKGSSVSRDLAPLSKHCSCYCCQTEFPRAYLRHLILERQPLGIHLLTEHNLKFIFDLINLLKEGIVSAKI